LRRCGIGLGRRRCIGPRGPPLLEFGGARRADRAIGFELAWLGSLLAARDDGGRDRVICRDRRGRGCGNGASADIVLHHQVGRAADHDQVLDVVTAHQEQLAPGIDRCSLQHRQPAVRVRPGGLGRDRFVSSRPRRARRKTKPARAPQIDRACRDEQDNDEPCPCRDA
jgi:hypothetical protein